MNNSSVPRHELDAFAFRIERAKKLGIRQSELKETIDKLKSIELCYYKIVDLCKEIEKADPAIGKKSALAKIL